MSFVHLHTHSHYTFQQALGTPLDIVKRAKSLDQTAIALTDRGNLHGAFEFYEAAHKEWIKPIVWVEFMISRKGRWNRERDNDLYEIVLLAKDFRGYQNLIELVTLAHKEWYYNWEARIDEDLLKQYSGNIIALSGSMYWEIAQHITTGREESYICERIESYETLFWKGNFYLEIEEHPDRAIQSRINSEIVRFSRKYGYLIVWTQNSYYIRPEDAEIRDLIAAVADGRQLDNPERPTLMNGDYSIRASDEMQELFMYAPEAYENTTRIADMIHLEIPHGQYHIPTFPLSPDEQNAYETYIVNLPSHEYLRLTTEEWLLRKMCIEWLRDRYQMNLTQDEQLSCIHKRVIHRPNKKLSEMVVEELYDLSEAYYSEKKKGIIAKMSDSEKSIVRRLEYELTVVDIMGFNGYFCIVADFIRYAKTHNIPVWPWRGSAAGAILAYLSGITDIDPLRYGLLFERFLNPARVSMPDIDVDFSDTGRDEVLVYVRKKYGEDHVAQVCTFGTLAARAAVKDAWKALGIGFAEMNDLAKLIPWIPGMTLEKALKESPDFQNAYTSSDKYTKVIDSAKRMEWTVRQLGVHACAVIIAPHPITCYCPVQPPPKDPHTTVTQFSAHPLEDLGLLKVDFLGLKNLTILARAIAIVQRVHKIDIDLLRIDYEDQKVLARFWAWDTTGLFQFESSWMRKYLQQLKPSSFEDLIAMVSLYRPWPLQYIPEFIDRKHGRKKIAYPHPSLENILKPTYGIAVYQEQIMQLVQAFAGFSLGEADILRRAIGKKKYTLLMEQRSKFLEAAEKLGHPIKLATYIFDEIIEPFAWYGFNKSHAACYAMIAYQTAYMKHYYPTEFMTAIMTSDEEDTDRIRMEIEEAKAQGITVLPPDVNESMKHFTFIDREHIRFGLKAIKWLGQVPIETILNWRKEQKYQTIDDFIERTGADVINKKSLEVLIIAWALDSLGERASLLASIPKIIAYYKEVESKHESLQLWIFDLSNDEQTRFLLIKVEPMTFEEKIRWEKAIIGYPVSGHPLTWLDEYIRKKSKNIGVIDDWISHLATEKSIESDVIEEEVSEWNDTPGIPSLGQEVEKSPFRERQTLYKSLPKVRIIGVVNDVRHMTTKKGEMMCVAKVQSIGFEFRIVIFSRSYEVLAPKIQEDQIVVCDGKVRFDDTAREITLMPDMIESFTLTKFRELRDKQERANQEEYAKSEKNTYKYEKEWWDDSMHLNEKYIIPIPSHWTREDLLALRNFLEGEEKWNRSVWIWVNGIEKDTKFSLRSLENVEKWVAEKKRETLEA